MVNLLTRIFFTVLVCALALVAGRSIAHAIMSSGTSYNYDTSSSSSDLQSTGSLTSTLQLSDQDDQSVTATPIVLSPRPVMVVSATMVILTPTVTSTEGPTNTPTATHVPTSTPIPPYVKYTVRRGDTLLKIAESFNTSRQSIIDANPEMNINDIREGDKLHIPAIVPKGKAPEAVTSTAVVTPTGGDVLPSPSTVSTVENTDIPVATAETTESVVSPTATTTTETTTTDAYTEYTVKQGDTLLSIAKAFNTTAKAILNVNDVANPEQLHIGQVLRIPSGGTN